MARGRSMLDYYKTNDDRLDINSYKEKFSKLFPNKVQKPKKLGLK